MEVRRDSELSNNLVVCCRSATLWDFWMAPLAIRRRNLSGACSYSVGSAKTVADVAMMEIQRELFLPQKIEQTFVTV